MKLVLFDLDGVLIDAKELHYDALNYALPQQYRISEEEHLSIYDGLKTRQKLDMLTERKGLPVEQHDLIHEMKQEKTIELFDSLPTIPHVVELFEYLYGIGYSIGVCSNSVRRSVLTALSNTGLIKYCSIVLSNEDVKHSKPHPEMYWKAMSLMGVLPEDTLIIEDSPPGLLAGARSGAKVVRVDNPSEVTIDRIEPELSNEKKNPKWSSKKLNVLIPMAGAGSRFAEAGYTFPKPLIPIHGKPMIQVVTENLGVEANFIYVVQKEHLEKYNLSTMLNLISPGCTVVVTDGITEGAACTALLAEKFIDSDDPLFFANSDQFVEWNPLEFFYNMQETSVDGGIVTFKAVHPKWSFAKVDDRGFVTEVAEKNPISDNATVGYYYWSKGSDFVKYAKQMIKKDIRVNNEFYVCPVFNQAIEDKKKIKTFTADKMWGLGTPEDLEYYIAYYKE